MPFTAEDVEKHTKKATTEKLIAQWVGVANSVLEQCIADGGNDETCAPKAIQQANGVIAKAVEELGIMPDKMIKIGEVEIPLDELLALYHRYSEAVWTAAYINTLPDSSFAVIMPGGEKDEEGKTAPRSLRKLPYKDAEGNVDLPHLRNALARLPQMEGVSAELVAKAKGKLETEAEKRLKTRQEEAMSEIASLAEVSFGYAVNFIERESPEGPAYIDLVPLKPGWGNKKDNHYYPHGVVRESAPVWMGAKMWATDHRQEDKNALNQISEVVQAPAGYTNDGVPFVRAVILSPEFEEVVRRRKRAGILDNLHCSILASGTVRKQSYEENGRKGKYVESISPDGAGIDWVTKAGAGGHATAFSEGGIMKEKEEKKEERAEVQEVELREGDEEQEVRAEEKTKEPLAEAEVEAALKKTNLPGASQQRLAEIAYQDLDALESAIKAEKAYIKELTGSGKPVGMGGTKSLEEISPEEVEEKRKARFNRIMREVGAKEV